MGISFKRAAATLGAWLAIVAGGCDPAQGQAQAQGSLFDPAFEEIRKASVGWDRRNGPERQVVDVVCLVPDLATYYEAIAAWDEAHFFPVLIDDVETTFKFLRAFRPARIVRYAGKPPKPGDDAHAWDRAVAAVGRAWQADDKPAPPGDVRPAALGPLPPGVVLASPDSPSLGGAVALAAGRFQPLVQWAPNKRFGDLLSQDEAQAKALEIETLIADRFPRYDAIGDECDFVTLAGDYPYRYVQDGQPRAFDDLILRSTGGGRRWAYAGRLMGDHADSVYRAMCALFLAPGSAVLYNTYSERDKPWSDYAMGDAAPRLSKALPVSLLRGDRAALPGWHKTFDPVNPFGLVILNTHGGPNNFHLDGGTGQTADVPETIPTAVLMIHSFSAAEPSDPDTVAGRWLANGAFVYFGSMYEPFLQSFRSPPLVASFLGENLPVVTAVRKTSNETFGTPWRLVYFGDPLYRLRPLGPSGGGKAARLADWEPLSTWPTYGAFQKPTADAAEATRLAWVLKTAIFGLQTSASAQQKPDLAATLLGIDRDRLEPRLRTLHDDLVADQLPRSALIERFAKIPPPERSPKIKRHLETAQTASLLRAMASKDFRQAVTLWSDVIRASGSPDFVRTFTERVGRLAETSKQEDAWRDRLRSALKGVMDPANTSIVESEKKRVEEKLAARGR